MTSHCVILDGSECLEELNGFQRAPHLTWHDGVEKELPDGMIPVLNGVDECLAVMLRTFLRQRRKTFVLPGVGYLSEDSKARLSYAVQKRRGGIYVLGGKRLLPICAGIREVISGGTLGTVQSATATVGASAERWSVFPSLVSWLAGGIGSAECCFDESKSYDGGLTVDIVCGQGMLHAMGSWRDGRGSLEVTSEGGNGIHREFQSGISDIRQELNVLAGFGAMSLFCKWNELEI